MLDLADKDLEETFNFFGVHEQADLDEFVKALRLSSQRDYITMQEQDVGDTTQYTANGPLAHFVVYKDKQFRIKDDIRLRLLDAALEIASKKVK